MKGLFMLFLLAFTLNVFATPVTVQNLSAIHLQSGEIIENLSLQESTLVLESLDSGELISIRGLAIDPEEITQIIVSTLTDIQKSGKRPNPGDYL